VNAVLVGTRSRAHWKEDEWSLPQQRPSWTTFTTNRTRSRHGLSIGEGVAEDTITRTTISPLWVIGRDPLAGCPGDCLVRTSTLEARGDATEAKDGRVDRARRG
jgi:hypothetical protein